MVRVMLGHYPRKAVREARTVLLAVALGLAGLYQLLKASRLYNYTMK